MMAAALEAVRLTSWRYQRLPVPPELFAETVLALPAAGFRGVNVTIPHKQAALAIAHEASAGARAIGAANTRLLEPGGTIVAENTDAPALLNALPIAVAQCTALVLGAGGSARAAVWALISAGVGEVRVWNRHPDRARKLCEELGCSAVADAQPADLLVNCTPVGGDWDVGFKQLPVRADELAMFRCVVDFVYGRDETELVRAAKGFRLPAVDGLELLVGQGSLSFQRFTGLIAPLEEMRAAARER